MHGEVVLPEKICSFEELRKKKVVESSITINGNLRDVFVFIQDGKCLAYINSCPHTGVNLNWQPGNFFSHDKKFIECSMHGALFEPGTGYCIHGPCAGQNLHALEVIEKQGNIYI